MLPVANGLSAGIAVGRVARRGRVDPQQLAEQVGRIARPSFGVAARPAVAHRHVEHAVGTELQIAAVVVRVRLVDVQQHALGVDVERAVGGDRVLGDDRVAVVVGVVEPGQRAVGGEGDPEQAALAVGARPVGEVGDLVDL